MAGPDPSPFDMETLDELKDRLKELDQADIIIDKASRAGIDMKAQQEKSQELRQQLMKFRQAFFPGQ